MTTTRSHDANDARPLTMPTVMGAPFMLVAFLARLPFAMTVVGTLFTLVGFDRSLAEAGLASAFAGVATAVAAPLVGGWVDRRGQRGLLIVLAVLNAAALAAFVALAALEAPLAAVLAISAVIGMSSPQVAPMSRTRVVASLERRGSTSSSPSMTSAMTYESIADESAYVLGPILVSLAALLAGSWAPLLAAAVLNVSIVIVFATHGSAAVALRGPAAGESGQRERLPARLLWFLAGMLLVGAAFGATLTSVTGTMQSRGLEGATGILYGVMSVGSILSALVMGRLLPRFGAAGRWLVFAAIALVAVALLPGLDSLFGLGVALFIEGCGIGVMLVALFSLANAASPATRKTTAMASMSACLVVGQSLATALVGALVDAQGFAAGTWALVATCAVSVLVAAGSLAFGRGRSQSPGLGAEDVEKGGDVLARVAGPVDDLEGQARRA